MQKHSADVEKGLPLYRRWRFWLGFLVNMGSEVGLTTVALALAPLSFIAPLAGLAVVFNAVIAHLGLVPGVKERMGCQEWLATACIMGGVTLVAISGPGGGDESPAQMAVADLPAAFDQLAFHIYAIIAAVIVFAWLVLTEQRCSRTLRERYRPHDDSQLASIGSSFTAAVTSGFSIIFLKVVALGVAEWAGQKIFPPPIVFICLGCLCVSAPLQLYLLNMTLASGRATFTIPLYLSLTMLLTSASGGVLFSEFEFVARRDPAPLWLVVYGVAVLIVMVALVWLSSRQEAKAQKSRTRDSNRPSPSTKVSPDEIIGAPASRQGSPVLELRASRDIQVRETPRTPDCSSGGSCETRSGHDQQQIAVMMAAASRTQVTKDGGLSWMPLWGNKSARPSSSSSIPGRAVV